MSGTRPFSRVTIADVAERAGVSIATVSGVLNQTAPVTTATEAQVQVAIAELNYHPHAAAQVLAGRKTNTLSLLLPEISGDYFPAMLRGIEAAARENGFSLLVCATHDGDALDAARLCPLGEHNTDGLLAFTDSLSDAELNRLHLIGFPVVVLHRSYPEGLETPCVTVDNKAGARKLVDHLVEVHGYRRNAFLSGPPGNEDSCWRERGYRESLKGHDIPFDPAPVAASGFDEDEAELAVEQWLGQGVEIHAIVTGDDGAAVGVLKALARAGKRVPDDVAIGGFDDVPLSCYLNPPLTAVRIPIETAGWKAVQQLIGLIHRELADPLVLLPTELVIRLLLCLPAGGAAAARGHARAAPDHQKRKVMNKAILCTSVPELLR